MPKHIRQQRDKAMDLEGAQDQGGKHGGQAGMPDPTPKPGSEDRKGDKAEAKATNRRASTPTE